MIRHNLTKNNNNNSKITNIPSDLSNSSEDHTEHMTKEKPVVKQQQLWKFYCSDKKIDTYEEIPNYWKRNSSNYGNMN